MFFWSAFPFVRIVIAFILGIICAVFLPGHQSLVIGTVVLMTALLVGSFFVKGKWFLKHNWIFGTILIVLSFAFGYARLYMSNESNNERHLVRISPINAYKAKVVTQPIQKGNFYKATVELNYAKKEEWQPAVGKITLYIKSDSLLFNYGDALLVLGSPELVKGPMNPEEFNYKRYLSFLNIYHQHFVESTNIFLLSSGNGSVLISKSIKVRNHFSSLLKRYLHGKKELAIANALLLGNKDELDDDIKNTYAASGAMHVLAVSGLHVGIIYLMVLYLIKLIPESYRKEWLIAALAIPLLWGYAFITGLSPSVLRAVTLFSIISIGRTLGRKSGMVNILAVSAFILLLYNPYILMQVGFQLSYVAVMGIIFIYPQIRKLWMLENRIAIFLWDITSISLAAQIATFPLSILYFHRFPPYFIASNLVVIPMATLMVWMGVILFSVSGISSIIAGWVGFMLEGIIKMVNRVLEIIHQLPWSNLDSIYLDIVRTWLLYGVISFFLLYVIRKKKEWAILVGVCIVLFTIQSGVHWVQINKSKQIVLYNVPKHYAVDMIQSGSLFSMQDSLLIKMDDKIRFHIKPNRLLNGIGSRERPNQLKWRKLPYGKAVVWNGISILVLNKGINKGSFPFDIVYYTGWYGRVEVSERLVGVGSKDPYMLTANGALTIDVPSVGYK